MSETKLDKALVATGGLFLIVQILALVLSLLKIQHYSTLDMVLIISDILALLPVLWLSVLCQER